MNLLIRFSKFLGMDKFKLIGFSGVKKGKIPFEAVLSARVIYKEGNKFGVIPGIVDKGVICRKCVTDDFVEFLVDKLVAAGNINLFKYHDAGIGTTAEDVTDSALETPWGGARVSGTQLEGASAEIYKTVATIDFTSAKEITEHGLFSLSAAGLLADRSVFGVINVDTNVSIEFTYELTINSGG